MNATTAKFGESLRVHARGYTYERLTHRMRRLLGGVSIEGKQILEIGAGDGLMSIWMALNGASHVIALDPEGPGSTPGVAMAFSERVKRLGVINVEFIPKGIEEHGLSDGRFDVILSYNSINHLCESHHDFGRVATARSEYLKIFRELFRLLAPGGVAIVADCSRHNMFNLLRIRHPLNGVRSIDWSMHQRPRTWIALMRETGWRRFRCGWYVPYPLRRVPWIADNALFAWLTVSHFTIWAHRD